MQRALCPLIALMLATTVSAFAANDEIPRAADGHPDLSGTYDIALLTPLERPAKYGDKLYLTKEEAEQIEKEQQEYVAQRSAKTNPNRTAPGKGGAPPVGLDDSQRGISGAGQVGGYNNFWIDRGDSVVMVDGKFRTSILTDPPNGRRPPLTAEARKAFMTLRGYFGGDEGSAFWIDWDRPGPYDNPENRSLSDRCIGSFSSAVPALPSLYNNVKRIVQTEHTVMIENEMVHDARVVRMNAEHMPPEMTFWSGDSVGHWEGDTLVVDTTNFRSTGSPFGTSATLHVVERFSRPDANNVHYEFTVEDPARYTAPYTGDFNWPATDDKLFEYACHEGNYAMGGMLRGARLLERDAMEAKKAQEGK